MNGSSESYISEIRYGVPYGAEMTLTVTDTANFAYWRDRNNKIVSREPAYTFTVTGADEFVAVFNTKLTGKVTVVYESYYAQVIARTQLSAGSAATWKTPDTPTRLGFTCTGWSLEGDALVAAVESALATETTDDDVIVITPVYVRPADLYTVVVENGTGGGEYAYDTFVTLQADQPAEGMKFAYWVDENGTVLSYRTDYRFFVTENTTVKAVFVTEEAPVEPVGITVVQSVRKDTANGKLHFVSWAVVPEDCAILKAGFLVSTDQAVAESSEGITAENAARVATGTTEEGQLRYTYSVKSSKVVYGRAYLVYSDADGVLHTVYGETVSASLADE